MNTELKENTTLILRNGDVVKVNKLLGSGGQGFVYSVTVNGEECALKWYKQMPSDIFYENLQKNAEEGAPSPSFLWPRAVTKKKFGSFGYIMSLKPDGYYEFSEYRLAKVRFSSFRAILNAAIELCEAFRLLHAKGLSYQDLNDGGFFIHPETGHLLICDCDNVFPHGDSSGVLGKARYIAPEIVMGKNMPNSYSDRFSMTVMIFMLFCIDHPFEGMNVVRHPCMTEEIERRLFGEQLCFMYDDADTKNRPVRGVHSNAILMWSLLPNVLRDTFKQEFSKGKLDSPDKRLTEMQWIDILTRVRDSLVICPLCGDESFITRTSVSCINHHCNGAHSVMMWFETGDRSIPLINNNILRTGKGDMITGRVVLKPGTSDVLLIQNLTKHDWRIITPSNKSVTVAPRGFFPAKVGMKVEINDNETTITYKINN